MNDTPVKQPTISRALLPLIMIPITVIIDFILLVGGFIIDKAVYEPKPDVPSFMFPFFTIVFGFIALVVSIIALIIMIVLVCVGISKMKRAKNEEK